MVTGEPLLRLRGVCTHFPVRGGFLGSLVGRPSAWVRAVDGVDLDVHAGEIFGLVGESGSGKTTLGRTMLRLAEPVRGTVEFEGRDITHLSESELRPLRRRMQPVFQDPHAALNPAMTVGYAVAHPLRIHGLASDRADARRQAGDMLERVGIAPAGAFLDRYPEDLSGGQKQRVVIARALVTRPRLLVADEPVAMLDMSVRAKILELLLDLKRDFGLTYVFITHDLATAKFVCDRIAILYLGKVVETGPAAAVYGAPQHPYTRALLDAVPSPDPGHRSRPRRLPSGEVPDAVDPPGGCRFHPRCPDAFAPCGWEGRDLVAGMEERWTDPATFQAEAGLVGPIDDLEVSRHAVVFPRGGEALAELLGRLRDTAREAQPPARVVDSGRIRTSQVHIGPKWEAGTVDDSPDGHSVFSAVAAIESDGPRVTVRLESGPEPRLQSVEDRLVACHLHGVTDASEPPAPAS